MANERSPDYDDKTDEAPVRVHQRGGPLLEPNEARAGMTHHNVRYVLAVSLGLIVVAFIVVYVLFFAGSSPPTIPAKGP